MSSELKVELETETEEACCVCGVGGALSSPEEHDAAAPPLQAPLRSMLLHLNNNKVLAPRYQPRRGPVVLLGSFILCSQGDEQADFRLDLLETLTSFQNDSSFGCYSALQS